MTKLLLDDPLIRPKDDPNLRTTRSDEAIKAFIAPPLPGGRSGKRLLLILIVDPSRHLHDN